MAESAGNPINVEDRSNIPDDIYTANVNDGSYTNFADDRYGYGLCQWTLPSRKEALLAYAKCIGASIGDADMQFNFMKKEMQERYSTIWSILSSTSDPYNAGYMMCMQYERSANTEASSHARGNRAEEIYEKYKDAESKTMYYNPQKVIDIAVSQIGYHEKASNSVLDDPNANSGDQNWTKYARDLDAMSRFYNGRKNGFAWCDIFIDWCFVQAYGREAAQKLLCQPNDSLGAGCSYSAGYFRSKGQFHIKDPKPGDQIFFGTGPNNVWHTGLIIEVTSSHVVTVEGNTSDMVGKRTYRLNDSTIYGYGRPDWGTPTQESVSNETSHSTPSVVIEVPVTTKPVQMCSPRIPLLKKGADSGYVKAAQILLGERGFSCGGKIDPITKEEIYDGEFGSGTENSVKEFQRKSNLLVDGEIGANTWTALLNL